MQQSPEPIEDYENIIKSVFHPIPQAFTNVCREISPSRVIVNDGESNVEKLTPADHFYWNMVIVDAVGCIFSSPYCLEQSREPLEFLEGKLGVPCVEAYAEMAQERVKRMLAELPSDIRDATADRWIALADHLAENRETEISDHIYALRDVAYQIKIDFVRADS